LPAPSRRGRASAQERNGVREVDASPGVAGKAVCTTGCDWLVLKTLKGAIAYERVRLWTTLANVHGEVVGEGGRKILNIVKTY